MPTDVIRTIGVNPTPVVPDYSTLQSWADDCPGNLTAVDQRYIGELLDQGEFVFSGTGLVVTSVTTDATRYIILRCAAGASFRDKPAVRETPLFYDATKGVAIRDTLGGYGHAAIWLAAGGTRVIGIQLRTPATTGLEIAGVSGNLAFVDSCILEASSVAGGAYGGALGCQHTRAVNCLFVATGTSGLGACALGPSNFILGCTGLHMNGTGPGFTMKYGGTSNFIQNTVVLNAAGFGDDNIFHSWGGSHNATDSPSITFGSNNLANLVAADQVVAVLSDLRALETADIVGAGTPDPTYLSTDITGTPRDAIAPTIGAWEFVPTGGGGGSNINIFMNAYRQMRQG